MNIVCVSAANRWPRYYPQTADGIEIQSNSELLLPWFSGWSGWILHGWRTEKGYTEKLTTQLSLQKPVGVSWWHRGNHSVTLDDKSKTFLAGGRLESDLWILDVYILLLIDEDCQSFANENIRISIQTTVIMAVFLCEPPKAWSSLSLTFSHLFIPCNKEATWNQMLSGRFKGNWNPVYIPDEDSYRTWMNEGISMVCEDTKLFINYFMYMNVLPSCNIYALHVCLVLPEVGRKVIFPGSGITDTYEPYVGSANWI